MLAWLSETTVLQNKDVISCIWKIILLTLKCWKGWLHLFKQSAKISAVTVCVLCFSKWKGHSFLQRWPAQNYGDLGENKRSLCFTLSAKGGISQAWKFFSDKSWWVNTKMKTGEILSRGYYMGQARGKLGGSGSRPAVSTNADLRTGWCMCSPSLWVRVLSPKPWGLGWVQKDSRLELKAWKVPETRTWVPRLANWYILKCWVPFGLLHIQKSCSSK